MSDDANDRLGIYGGFAGPPLAAGVDRFDRKQEPRLTPVDDLSKFVAARIVEAETEPRTDAIDPHASLGDAIAYRYAGYIRKDCVVYRQIVEGYCYAKGRDRDDEAAASLAGLRLAVLAVANRWAGHPEFRDEWRLA